MIELPLQLQMVPRAIVDFLGKTGKSAGEQGVKLL